MDINALLEPVLQFFSQGIGAVIADIIKALYHVLYPSNAEAATTDIASPTPAVTAKP